MSDMILRAARGAVSGVQIALVRDLDDPENRGRVRIEWAGSHSSTKEKLEAWARVAVPYAGEDRGMQFMPEIGDEVLIAFERGDLRYPVVIGSLWSGAAQPPTHASSSNDRKVLRTRSGATLTMDDEAGDERIELETPHGARIRLSDGARSIRIETDHAEIRLTPSGVDIQTAGTVTTTASSIELNAGFVRANTPYARFAGVVQTDTLIANSVVASSYTPGAGNVL